MKKLVLGLFIFFITTYFTACGRFESIKEENIKKDENEQEGIELADKMQEQMIQDHVKSDLTETLNTICNGENSGNTYIYNLNLSRHMKENDMGNEEISNKIIEKVEYEIADISIDKNVAEAEVKVIAPNTYVILESIASTMQENNVIELLDIFNKQLDEDYPIKEFNVTVNLKLVDEHWYLIVDGQLSNALTGGLVEQYSIMGEDIIEQLLEESDNE